MSVPSAHEIAVELVRLTPGMSAIVYRRVRDGAEVRAHHHESATTGNRWYRITTIRGDVWLWKKVSSRTAEGAARAARTIIGKLHAGEWLP